VIGIDDGDIVPFAQADRLPPGDKRVMRMQHVHRFDFSPSATGKAETEMIARIGKGNGWGADNVQLIVLIVFFAQSKDKDLVIPRFQGMLVERHKVGHSIDNRLVDQGHLANAHRRPSYSLHMVYQSEADVKPFGALLADYWLLDA
jgi:hypothetical protein